jgi:hypothetical protein
MEALSQATARERAVVQLHGHGTLTPPLQRGVIEMLQSAFLPDGDEIRRHDGL